MSSRLRSLNSTKISFFAFQDIITSVSGILILVTLLLATELDRRSSDLHEANPELERKLAKALRDQRDVEAQNANLRAVLTAAETAPPTEKLESDITRLREQLVEERKKYSSIAEQLAASQSAIETRDDRLMLTRNGEFVQVGGRFPRLARRTAVARLNEIRKILLALAPVPAAASGERGGGDAFRPGHAC